MLEIEATYLSPGDELTKDNGETWITVKVIRFSDKSERVVVIDTNNKEHIFRFTETVIVRL